MPEQSNQEQIKEQLTLDFKPLYLEVQNDSGKHRGHAQAGTGGDTHFRICLVSPVFDGQKPLERHRAVYQSLAGAMKTGVHALQLDLLSPSEWHARKGA